VTSGAPATLIMMQILGRLRNRLHSIGVSVTDTTPEIRIATQM
jgi:hypothetical protein